MSVASGFAAVEPLAIGNWLPDIIIRAETTQKHLKIPLNHEALRQFSAGEATSPKGYSTIASTTALTISLTAARIISYCYHESL